MNPTPDWKNKLPLSIFRALVFFAILWRMDFPKPMVDDLFYTGAGMNLASGGDFSNPLLARQEFPSHFFFVYPPFHSYALAGWLKLFGISASSMTAFPVLMYFITTVATILILRKHSAPRLLEWLVPLGVSTALLSVGLRSEPVSIALTMAGFALFDCGRKGVVSLLFAFLLMFTGASAAPRMALFSAALILLAANRLWVSLPDQRSKKLRLWLPLIVAMGIAGLIFLAQIHFRVGEFWQSFHAHAQRVGGRRINLVIGFLNENHYLNSAQFSLILFLVGLLVFAWQRQMTELTRMALVLAGEIPLVALTGGLGAGTLWYIVLTLLCYAAAVIQNQPALANKMKVMLVLAFCFANVGMFITLWGMATGKIEKSRGSDENIALAARSVPGHTVLVDHAVARYIFDYRIPAGLLDIQFAAPFPGSHIVGKMVPGDIYLVGPENVHDLKEVTLLDVAVPAWIPFSLPNRHFDRYPCQVFVIPMEECHGLRQVSNSN